MIASLLPGFRELRAPFASGAVLLAALYVAGYEKIRPATGGPRLGVGLNALFNLLGGRGRLVVLGVVTYLVGTVVVAWTRGLIRRLSLRLLPRTTNQAYLVSKQTRWMATAAPFSRASLRRVLGLCQDEFGDASLAEAVCSEVISGGGKRLLVKNKDLYVEWDRLKSEAEFRDAMIGPALLFATLVLPALQWPWWGKTAGAIAVIVILSVLWGHARQLDREANSMYAHAIADGTVATASIDARRQA